MTFLAQPTFNPGELFHNLPSHADFHNPSNTVIPAIRLPTRQQYNLDQVDRVPSTYKREHSHWCTSRLHQGEIKTCAACKRHEKEDEEYYIFIPSGPIEESSRGPRCVLCQHLRPDESHFKMHGILQYVEGLKEPVKKTRKSLFENLLKEHKVTDPQAIQRLTHKWHKVETKKSYSCGLCIAFFRTRIERTSHYESEHFSKGHDLKEWDDNNIIKGHLLRPELHDECERVFGLDPCQKQSEISWHPSCIEELRRKLELGLDSLSDLALDAVRKCEWGASAQTQAMPPPSETSLTTSSNSGRIGISYSPLTLTVRSNTPPPEDRNAALLSELGSWSSKSRPPTNLNLSASCSAHKRKLSNPTATAANGQAQRQSPWPSLWGTQLSTP